jgi:hypothetical protein
VTKQDIFAMKNIEAHYNINVEELPEGIVFH